MKEIKSEMTGVIDQVLVEEGSNVEVGQKVIVVESMKSLITIESSVAGAVQQVLIAPGDFVEEGQVLLVLE